jgi:hypothetical protein
MAVLADGVGGGQDPIPPTAKMVVFHTVLFPVHEVGVDLHTFQ